MSAVVFARLCPSAGKSPDVDFLAASDADVEVSAPEAVVVRPDKGGGGSLTGGGVNLGLARGGWLGGVGFFAFGFDLGPGGICGFNLPGGLSFC